MNCEASARPACPWLTQGESRKRASIFTFAVRAGQVATPNLRTNSGYRAGLRHRVARMARATVCKCSPLLVYFQLLLQGGLPRTLATFKGPGTADAGCSLSAAGPYRRWSRVVYAYVVSSWCTLVVVLPGRGVLRPTRMRSCAMSADLDLSHHPPVSPFPPKVGPGK